MYLVFHRTWWTKDGRPEMGRKTEIRKVDTAEQARELAEAWTRDYLEKHNGYNPQSRKAEWTKL
jgi:hypothetical protein